MAIIDKPSDYFNTKLYTGNGGTQSITGVGFQPDFNWTKSRTTTQSHVLTDAVRGVTKTLFTNATQAEATLSGITAFGTDGYTLGASDLWSENSASFASWNWKANGSGSANTDGSINSTVSANTTAGFSIATWTTPSSGTQFTIGHGLGQAPGMMIMKCTSQANSWFTYHQGLGGNVNDYLILDASAAEASQTNMWGANGAQTNTMGFKAGTSSYTNEPMIGYFFAEKQGYSKFLSYVGNGNDNGTFVYTGFKPSFVMIKRTNSTASWLMFDNKRANPFNEITADLRADLNNAEDASTSYNNIDFLSNGFKIRKSNADINASGGTYIYMAIAENPFVASNFNAATAR